MITNCSVTFTDEQELKMKEREDDIKQTMQKAFDCMNKKTVKSKKKKCDTNQLQSRVPVIRRQIFDLHQILDNIFADAKSRTYYHRNWQISN